jgi:hypothetical protein
MAGQAMTTRRALVGAEFSRVGILPSLKLFAAKERKERKRTKSISSLCSLRSFVAM